MTGFTRCVVTVLAVTLPAAAQPNITAVFNAFGGAGQTKLTPGVFFAVQGNGLADPNPSLQTAPQPYPTVFLHASVAFTATTGGSPIAAKMWYASPTQINAILPSTATPGTYNVTVTYNSQTSTGFQVSVVERSFGIATADSSGSGPAQATDGNVNNGISLVRFTSSNVSYGGYTWVEGPAHVNDELVFWGSGGGKDLANDSGGSSGDMTAVAHAMVFINGVGVTPDYFGTSQGYPGLWQANVKVPASINPSCGVTAYIQTQDSDGTTRTSNTVSIAVAATGQNACSSTLFTQAQLAKLDAGGALVWGGFRFDKSQTSISLAGISFTSYSEGVSGSFNQLRSADVVAQYFAVTTIPPCVVFTHTGPETSVQGGAVVNALDAGATLPTSGPGIAAGSAMQRDSTNNYSLSLYSGMTPGGVLTNGTYSVKGTGGADVGAFNASVNVPGDFNPTNFDPITTVSRSSSLHLTWTGGGSGNVEASGFGAATVSGSYANPATWIVQATIWSCTWPASQGAGDVPASVLSQMPAVSNDLTTGSFGELSIAAVSDGKQGQFTAPLVKLGGNIDFGLLDYSIGKTKLVAYQ